MDLDIILIYASQISYSTKELDGSSSLIRKLKISIGYGDPDDIVTAILFDVPDRAICAKEYLSLTNKVIKRLTILKDSMQMNRFAAVDFIKEQQDRELSEIYIRYISSKIDMLTYIDPELIRDRIKVCRELDHYNKLHAYFLYQQLPNKLPCY